MMMLGVTLLLTHVILISEAKLSFYFLSCLMVHLQLISENASVNSFRI